MLKRETQNTAGLPCCQRHQLSAHFGRQAPHANEVLGDLCQPLLVLVHQELGPVLQVLVYLCQGACILPLEPADSRTVGQEAPIVKRSAIHEAVVHLIFCQSLFGKWARSMVFM